MLQSFRLVMYFDQRLHTQFGGQAVEGAELLVAEDCNDEQQCIGACHARLVDLVVVKDEVFAQDWHRAVDIL